LILITAGERIGVEMVSSDFSESSDESGGVKARV
jgi:hypothetical protein